jgi:hypothetical protein
MTRLLCLLALTSCLNTVTEDPLYIEEELPNTPTWASLPGPARHFKSQTRHGLFLFDEQWYYEEGPTNVASDAPDRRIPSQALVVTAARILVSDASLVASDLRAPCSSPSVLFPLDEDSRSYPLFYGVFAGTGESIDSFDLWPKVPVSQGLAPGTIRLAAAHNDAIAVALESREVWPAGGSTCRSISKLAILEDGLKPLQAPPIKGQIEGVTTSLALSSTEALRVVQAGDNAQMPGLTLVESLNRKTLNFKTWVSKTNVKDCHIFTTQPPSVMCVTADRQKALLINETGQETLVATSTAAQGLRLVCTWCGPWTNPKRLRRSW